MVSKSDRLAFTNRYIEAARQIAEKTKDPEVRRYWEHLFTYGAIVAPESSKGDNVEITLMRVVNGTGKLDSRRLIPILTLYPEDLPLNRHFPGMLKAKNRAMHQSDNNMIYLKASDRERDFIKGCAILHETGHAYKAHQERRIGIPSPEKATPHLLLEEGDLHYLEARMWKEKGGAEYLGILEQAVDRLIRSAGKASNCLGLDWDEQWMLVLDKLFGSTSAKLDRMGRMGSLAIFANFEAIDRSPIDNKRQARANIIDMTYKEMNFKQ